MCTRPPPAVIPAALAVTSAVAAQRPAHVDFPSASCPDRAHESTRLDKELRVSELSAMHVVRIGA